MLNLVRKHANSWLIKLILWTVIFAFIATIFYAWGMGGNAGGRRGVVATVNGHEISLTEYDQSFSNLVNFYRQQFRGQFSDKLIEQLDLKTEALDRLILSRLVTVEAEKQKIAVSDQELVERIQTLPAFQKDKGFDKNLYQNYLTYNRITARDFESDLRDQVQREKVEAFIRSNIHIHPEEIQREFNRENEKIRFSYVTFPKTHFEETGEPTDEELAAFFEKNSKQFEIPQRIKVQFVRLIPRMVEDSIEIRDEDVADYYESHQGEFHIKKQFKAKHILFRVNTVTGTDEESKKELEKSEKEALTKAEDILKKIRGGEDFKKMAKEHSEDTVSGANGGDLGQFSAGTMVPEFEEALDKLKVGDIGGPIKTTFGYHLIRLEEKKEARVKPLSEAQEEITKKLTDRKARLRIQRMIKKVYEKTGDNGDLAAAAQALGHEVSVTDFISKEDHAVPEIGVVPEFFNLAFTLPDNQISQPLNTPEASFLLKVIERKAPEIPQLDAVKDKVASAYKEKKTREHTKARFEELKKKLSAFGDLDKIAAELDLEVLETPLFSQADSIPGIGNIQEIKDNVFPLKPGGTTAGTSRFAYFLIKLKEREKAEDPKPEELKSIYDRLKMVRGSQVFKAWLEKAREQADIQIDPTLFNNANA